MLPVSVNISRVSLYYSSVVEKYESIIRSFDLDSKYIQLEITESATIDNNEIFNLLEQFHTAGFKILLDDFGSGYSSLAALNRMHFDTIKLDKSLVDYIGDDNGEKLLNSITKLAQSFGMEITAEGVETVEQLMFLCNLDCDDIQGYYFSRPLPVKEYALHSYNITIDTMEVQGERKDEDRGPSYEGGYLYSDICRTWDRTGHIAAFHVFT